MSKVFYWSDPHLGHDLVAHLRGFKSVGDHDQHILDRWSATVTKHDTIWILGDIAMSSPARALELIAELPGTKHLIVGNHDSAHPLNRGAHNQQRRYLQTFTSVQAMARHRIQGQEFMVSHFPYHGDHTGGGDRHTQWRLPDRGHPIIHGHVHDEWLMHDDQINVGIDRWMDGPPSSEQLHALYRTAHPRLIDTPPTRS